MADRDILQAFGVGALVGGGLIYLTLYHSDKLKPKAPEEPGDEAGDKPSGPPETAPAPPALPAPAPPSEDPEKEKQPPPGKFLGRTEIMQTNELAGRLRSAIGLFV